MLDRVEQFIFGTIYIKGKGTKYLVLKMHFTAKIRKTSYGWHVTDYHTPSHVPNFILCKSVMQVATAHLFRM